MAKRKSFSISNALTTGLEETIESARGYSGDLQVDVIPLRKVELDPDNPRELILDFEDVRNLPARTDPLYARKMQEIESLYSLAESIKGQGIINPITVYKHGEGYRLIAGERRTLASIHAGKLDIQAKILNEKPDPLKISLLQWIENVERSDLSLWERIRNLEKIVDAHQKLQGDTASKITVTGLSQLMGCSKPQAMLYKAVLEADVDVMSLIRDNKIRNLEKAALVSGIDDDEIRTDMAQAAVDGFSLPKLKVLLKQKQTAGPEIRTQKVRGRVPGVINMGSTRNMKVARIVLESLCVNPNIKHITTDFQNMDLRDPKMISNTLKRLIKKLEEIHA